MTLSVMDDIALPWRAIVQTAQDIGTPIGLRKINRRGQPTYYNGYWSINQDASAARNEVDMHQVEIGIVSEPTRYAA